MPLEPMPDDRQPGARPMAARVGAAVAAVVLAVAIPVLFLLGALAPKRYQPLISTLLVVSIAVPLVLWFTSRRTRTGDDNPEDDRSVS